MNLDSNERIEDLQCNGLKIIQNKTLYTFTSDSVILANFIKTKSQDVAVEIGAGCGVVSILVQAKNKVKKIYNFEIQNEMAKLCQKNICLNELEDKITIIKDDVKNFNKYLQKNSIDVVYSNPPYFKQTNFSQNPVKKIAKEEICLSCEELVNVAESLLKHNGIFYVCYSAERSAEIIYQCEKCGLTIKEMFFTENGKGDVKLVYLKCVKGGKNGVKIYPNLITNDKNGDYLDILKTRNYLQKK